MKRSRLQAQKLCQTTSFFHLTFFLDNLFVKGLYYTKAGNATTFFTKLDVYLHFFVMCIEIVKREVIAVQEKGSLSRKQDRRAVYTRNTVKDALLELLEKQHYERITVAALCRQAEITRATFYLHYKSLDEVLNELLDEALMVAESVIRKEDLATRMDALEQLAATGNADDLRRNEQLLGPCQRVADDPKYRAIFQDPTLAGYVINRIYRLERDEMIPYLMGRCKLDQGDADKMFMMIVFGLFYMNRVLKWSKDAGWYEMQLLVACFMTGGFEALRRKNQKLAGQ